MVWSASIGRWRVSIDLWFGVLVLVVGRVSIDLWVGSMGQVMLVVCVGEGGGGLEVVGAWWVCCAGAGYLMKFHTSAP